MRAPVPTDAGLRRQDLISRGLGSAARAIGLTTDALRPKGARRPLDPANRFLRLPTAFADIDGRFSRPVGYGSALHYGIFDTAYTLAGDYLVRADSVWFVAGQPNLLPALCVRTNRTVSFLRPAAPAASGLNQYGGVDRATLAPLLTDWPASVLGAAGGHHPLSELPSDSSVPFWSVLLPAAFGVLLRPADLMQDDLGRTAVVAAAELTELGWRIAVRQVTT